MKCGPGLKVEGVLGCCASGNVKNACVADTEMGIGKVIRYLIVPMDVTKDALRERERETRGSNIKEKN